MSPRVPRHAAREVGRARSRVVMSVLGAIAILGTLVGLAFAYWVTTDSSHPAAASASSLLTPTGVAATEASATAVNVSWTNPSGQLPGTEYVVQRTSPSTSTVCTTTGSDLGNTGQPNLCQDSGLASGTAYAYSVTAVLGNWTSSAATVSFTTMAVAITYPVNGTTYGPNWGGSITGTSSAATGQTIASVAVSVQQGSGGCWTGTGNAWTATCPNYVFVGTPYSSWSQTLPAADLNSGNTYHVTAKATDSLLILATTTASFTYNSSPPVPSPPVVSALHTYSGSVFWTDGQNMGVTDTVTPGSGTVTTVSYYWCTSSSCTSSNGTLIGTSTNGGPTWSVSWTSLPPSDGTYYVVAVATDSLSLSGTSTATAVGIDRTPPTVSTPSVNGQS